jgi:malonyl-CoA/methylmalonyl-CoA synthetase
VGAPYPDTPGSTDAELLFFSSGTTGRSKGIVIPWAALLRNVSDIASAFCFQKERHLLVLPLAHTNGQVVGLLAPLSRGGSVVLGETTGMSALFGLWTDLDEREISVVDCVPTVIQALLAMRQPRRGSSPKMRLFICGGAPIRPAVIAEFERLSGIPLLQEYGLSEAVCISSCERPGTRKLGSVGYPLDGTEIRIRDDAGVNVEIGKRGRVFVKAASLMRGYEAAGRIESPVGVDGFLATNDIGWFDEEGFLFIAGRSDDTLIKGGQNVVPADVEAMAQTFDGIAQCAVVGIPCGTYGEDLVVFYVASAGKRIDEAEFRAYLRDAGDRMWYPKAVVRVSELPATESGKILRRALREKFLQDVAGTP